MKLPKLKLKWFNPEKYIPQKKSHLLILWVDDNTKESDRCFIDKGTYRNCGFCLNGMLEPVPGLVLGWMYEPNIPYKP